VLISYMKDPVGGNHGARGFQSLCQSLRRTSSVLRFGWRATGPGEDVCRKPCSGVEAQAPC